MVVVVGWWWWWKELCVVLVFGGAQAKQSGERRCVEVQRGLCVCALWWGCFYGLQGAPWN
jgi:hypothetical protein